MSTKKRSSRKSFAPVVPLVSSAVQTRIRFDGGRSELDLVKAAAVRRGMGFNEFMRLVCLGAARRVMTAPPESILGQFAESAVDDI